MLSIRKRRKLIPLIIGLAVLMVLRKYELTIPGMDMVAMEFLVSIATLLGVERVPNEKE